MTDCEKPETPGRRRDSFTGLAVVTGLATLLLWAWPYLVSTVAWVLDWIRDLPRESWVGVFGVVTLVLLGLGRLAAYGARARAEGKLP